MIDILLRNIPSDVADTLSIKAKEDGKDRSVWLREQVIRLAAAPTIKKRYSFKAFGSNGTYVQIHHEADGLAGQGAKHCNEQQFDAYKKALEYVKRNELGDYEAAYKLLLANFDEVFAS